MRKINIQNCYEQVINDVLLDLYEKEFVDEKKAKIHQQVSKDIFSLKDILNENDNKQVIVFCKKTLDGNIAEKINKLLDGEENEYTIYFILRNIEEIIKTKNIINSQWKKSFPKIKKSKGVIRYIQLSNDQEKPFSIEIKSCLNRLDYTNGKYEGIVYTAKLLDLIDIYNFIGNSLLDENVRYKISDTLDVEDKIKETLENDPSCFWFYNNGIAMLAQKDGLHENEEFKITYQYSQKNQLQIINGAQTITCATEYYYELKHNLEKENANLPLEIEDKKKADIQLRINKYKKILDNFGKAYVVLRIVYNDNASSDFIKNVSLSLNRQKPIKNYDLKFMTPEVQIINSLYEDNDKQCPYFYILKSGETSNNDNSCDLITFMKIYAICELQKPGTARNGKGSLLADSYWSELKRKENEKDDEEYFNNHFKYFYLAKRINTLIEKVFKEINKNKEEILLYSKEFLTAYIIYILRKETNIKLDNYPSIIEDKMNAIAVKWVEELKNIDNKYNSNYFKKDTSYDSLKKELQKKQELSTLIKSILRFEEIE